MSDPNTMTLTITANNADEAMAHAKKTHQLFYSTVDLPHSKLTQVSNTKFIVSLSDDEMACLEENEASVSKWNEAS